MANNNYPQITSVTSESLQSQIRNLLPSQEGFGTDLMAQNVIVPIIDLTSAAEGSTVRQDLQSALAFASQTAFTVNNATTTIVNNTGFFRIFGSALNVIGAAATNEANFQLTDGLSTKKIWGSHGLTSGTTGATTVTYDFIVFLSTGISLNANCTSNGQTLTGSTRQIADVNGVLVNPAGFNPQ